MDETKLKRIGVSMEGDLLHKFDAFVEQKKYQNRSEAIRDLVRKELLQHTWEKDDQLVAGSILLFYDHHHRNLMEELTNIQHDMHDQVMATTHFHLSASTCLELIVIRGKAREIQALSDRMTRLKGVMYGELTIAPIEKI